MKRKSLLLTSVMASIMFAFIPIANANILNLDLNVDCEGYSISGAVDNFCWYWHSGDCLNYAIEVVHKNGSLSVEGEIDLIYEGSDPYECPSLPIEVNGSWDEQLCGNVIVEANILMIHQCLDWVDEFLQVSKEFYCPCDVGCNRTPGYWKNDIKPWPQDQITICNITYPRNEADAIMGTDVSGDKTYTMFKALVAAKLNVLSGSDDSCIADIISEAEQWMCDYGPVGSGVSAGGEDSSWRIGEALYIELDKYNNGQLCVPHCE